MCGVFVCGVFVCLHALVEAAHTCSARIEGNSTEMMLVNAASSENWLKQ